MFFTSEFLSDPETRYCPNCDTPITDPLTLSATGWCKKCLARDWRVVSEPVIQDAQHGGVVVGGIQHNFVKWRRSSEADIADRKKCAEVPASKDATTPPPVAPTPEQPAVRSKQGTTWQEAAERMERLRKQGEAFTSQQKLAADFGCSSGTINKAIKNTPSLRAWAKRPDADPKAQSLTDVVTDRTAQGRELDPADEFAIREYLEREDLTPDERAFFNSLSREDQLDFLDDPDKHRKVFGRKP
jgi:hypothetical protein